MELRQLRYFVVAGDVLNFSKASKMLYISQPGLSKNINEMEGLLGVKLFNRSSGKLSLTVAGEYLLKEAKKLIVDADRIEKETKAIAADNKRLCIIAMEGQVAEAWGNEYLRATRRLRDQYPLWNIRVCSTNLDEVNKQSLGCRVDLGLILHHNPQMLNVPNYCQIGKDRMGIVCHKDLLAGKGGLEGIKQCLSKKTLYYVDQNPSIHQHFSDICGELGIAVKDIQTTESDIAKLLIALQDGAMLMPARLAKKEVLDGLIFQEFPGRMAELGVYAIWHNIQEENLLNDFCLFFESSQ